MKLWLLTPGQDQSRWKHWIAVAGGFVIRAESEADARRVAADNCGEEGADAWLLPSLSSCNELEPASIAGLVLRDFVDC